MKQILYALGLSVLLFSCKQNQKNAVIYSPRTLTANEKFNAAQPSADSVFTIYKHNSEKDAPISGTEAFGIKFKDTVVSIQVNKADSSAADKFSYVQPVNTQQTTFLVQLANHPDLATAFYLIAFKDDKLNVISLNRPSTGKQDGKFTTGLNKIGRGGYLINNDFFITNVNAQVYLIKRQNPEERIQGEFILNSPDKSTLVFLQPSSLYEVHYESDEVFTQPLSKPAPATADLSGWIKDNFNWEKNKKGITFLKFSDSNRIVDIKEFG
ncbi:hypothetical protein HDC92_004250 [Pedobacter sp. AK017]|uniref:hypothetical protein n=1 Tax=Pedobacter sp. AK017 TaxID=2723073 RepID=UPI0016230595|nr:hypothetical protein [Pedobacter sp. AK017]MBB5440547.1 hypothetical protein [Pedobacter sp. AK017]